MQCLFGATVLEMKLATQSSHTCFSVEQTRCQKGSTILLLEVLIIRAGGGEHPNQLKMFECLNDKAIRLTSKGCLENYAREER
jgi:hypothetical protein